MSGGNSELLEVQEKLQTLTTEYDRLNDEWTGKLADQQADFQKEKHVSRKDLCFLLTGHHTKSDIHTYGVTYIRSKEGSSAIEHAVDCCRLSPSRVALSPARRVLCSVFVRIV